MSSQVESNNEFNPYQVSHIPVPKEKLGLNEVQFRFRGELLFSDLKVSIRMLVKLLVLYLILFGLASFAIQTASTSFLQSICLLTASGIAAINMTRICWNYYSQLGNRLKSEPDLGGPFEGTVDVQWIKFNRPDGFFQIVTQSIDLWENFPNQVQLSDDVTQPSKWIFPRRWFIEGDFHRFLNWSIMMDEYRNEVKQTEESMQREAATSLEMIDLPTDAIRLFGSKPSSKWAKLKRIPELRRWQQKSVWNFRLTFLQLIVFWLLVFYLLLWCEYFDLVGFVLFCLGIFQIFALQRLLDQSSLSFRLPKEGAVCHAGIFGADGYVIYYRSWKDFVGYYRFPNEILLRPHGRPGVFHLLQRCDFHDEVDWQAASNWIEENLPILNAEE